MKLKIPPAIQVLFFALIIWGIQKLTETKHLSFKYQILVSWLIFSAGILIGLIAIYSFRKARTTVDPIQPEKASHLVTNGIYSYSRNPMYLAMLFVLVAFAIRIGNYYSFVAIIGYVCFITKYQIKPEEIILTKLFGKDYLDYCSRVRRWI